LKREHRIQHLEAIIQQLESALHGLRRLQVDLARDVTPVTERKSLPEQFAEKLDPEKTMVSTFENSHEPERVGSNPTNKTVYAVWKNERLWPP